MFPCKRYAVRCRFNHLTNWLETFFPQSVKISSIHQSTQWVDRLILIENLTKEDILWEVRRVRVTEDVEEYLLRFLPNRRLLPVGNSWNPKARGGGRASTLAREKWHAVKIQPAVKGGWVVLPTGTMLMNEAWLRPVHTQNHLKLPFRLSPASDLGYQNVRKTWDNPITYF